MTGCRYTPASTRWVPTPPRAAVEHYVLLTPPPFPPPAPHALACVTKETPVEPGRAQRACRVAPVAPLLLKRRPVGIRPMRRPRDARGVREEGHGRSLVQCYVRHRRAVPRHRREHRTGAAAPPPPHTDRAAAQIPFFFWGCEGENVRNATSAHVPAFQGAQGVQGVQAPYTTRSSHGAIAP